MGASDSSVEASFHSHPTAVVHSGIIFPLLESQLDELRRRDGPMLLVEEKSHTRCLLNKRVDKWAEREFNAEMPEIYPAPRKYRSMWLGVGPEPGRMSERPPLSSGSRFRGTARRTEIFYTGQYVWYCLIRAANNPIATSIPCCYDIFACSFPPFTLLKTCAFWHHRQHRHP